jgi:Ca2+-binding RTX toxin-like protein
MLGTIAKRIIRQLGFFGRRPVKRPIRKGARRPLDLEILEDRRLLNGQTWTLQQVLSAYDPGAAALVQQAGTIADQVLGLNIPLVNETIAKGLNIARDFQIPFQTQPTGTDWNTVQSQLTAAGFTVLSPFTGSPDANGNLLEVQWALPATWNSASPLFTASGNTGFKYLDSATGAGDLLGPIATLHAPTFSFQVKLGVDVQNNQPSFFILDSSALAAKGLSLQGSLSGNLAIGSLSNVDVGATAALTISSAALTLNNVHGDHKLRSGDFASSGTFAGNVQGSLQLSASLKAHLPLLSDLTWTATVSGTINNGWQPGSPSLSGPSATTLLSNLGTSFLSSLGQSFFSGGSGLGLLGPLQSELNQPLPLINESIAQLTGLDSKLPQLPNLGSLNPANVLNLLSQYGIQVNDGDTSLDPNDPNGLVAMVNKLIQGQHVDLLSWTKSNSISLANYNLTIPIFSIGVPDIASAEIDATFGLKASLNYDVGFGVDTSGFWIKAGSANDPTLGLSFGVTAGLQGQVEVLGFPLAEAGGNIGFSINPYVALTAPPYSANPGRVYMSDLQMFGANPLTDFVDALSAGISGHLTGNVYASIDLFLFSISWSWGIDIPVFNFQHNPSWPAAPGLGTAGTDPYPAGPDANGILTFNGTPTADNVNLKQIGPGAIQLTWAGHGPTHTYKNVKQVDFYGDGGNDRLTTATGFAIPVRAESDSGPSDTALLQGGDGGATLLGGAGSDTLIGGKGNDSITGGSGNDLIIGGDGNDALLAGSGTDQIYSGGGNSLLVGGPGNDSLYGGGGKDTIHGGSGVYFIDGGSGNDVIYGDTGSGIIHAGNGNTTIDCRTCTNPIQIFGDGGSDVIYGGSGNDTIYAGTGGNNVVHGGGGNDLIYGGSGGDALYADTGNDTIYGGTGNEFLYGGDGLGLQPNAAGNGLVNAGGDGKSAGSSLLIAGPGNDVLYGDSTGHNTLHGGAGSDTLYAGLGGDYLAAGTGVDDLYGGPGNDSLQIPFTPTGQELDTVVGGGGVDTLVLKPTTVASIPGPFLASAIPDPTTTTITVSDVTAFSGPNPAVTLIRIDEEQLLVTGVSGNTLTVTRGSNGTTAGAHVAGAPVYLEPKLPAPTNCMVYFAKLAGAGNQYQATLSDLDSRAFIGQVNLTLPPDVGQVAIEGGPGNNFIQVDPSVTRNMFLYGGPGHNTLMAGSGSDTLVGGPGSSVLYGGIGDDFLYGGDMPAQDQQPVLDSAGTVTDHQPAPGRNTLIAGSGNDRLFAGPGGDLLIGGRAALENGACVLLPGAGRDVLEGGAGNDLLIAGSDSPGAALVAGTGNDTLVGGPGEDIMTGGPGNDLLLGGNLFNVMYGDPSGAGNNTLVGGAGLNIESGGEGNDILYDRSNPALWSQAQAAAWSQFQVNLPLPAGQPGDPVQEYNQLLAQENALEPQWAALKLLQDQGVVLTPDQQMELHTLSNELAAINLAQNAALTGPNGQTVLVDYLKAGSGNDQLYGGPSATWLIGGTGNGSTTFYNYNPEDTIQGGSGQETLMFQGDGAIHLGHVVVGGNDAVSVTIPGQNNGQPLDVGNGIANISGINTVGVQMLAGNDSVTFDDSFAGVPLYFSVQCGSGSDVIDASSLQAPATLLGGSGADVIKVGPARSPKSVYAGSTGNSELDVQGAGNDTVTVSGGALTVDGTPIPLPSSFQTLVFNGGPGNDTFTTDGSLPSRLRLSGGSGSSVFNITGGTNYLAGGTGGSTFNVAGGNNYLAGGSGPNVFTIGPSQDTILGGPGSNSLTVQATQQNVTAAVAADGSTVSLTGAVSATATNVTSLEVNGPQSTTYQLGGQVLSKWLPSGTGLNSLMGSWLELAAGVTAFSLDTTGNVYYLTSDGGLTTYTPAGQWLSPLTNPSFEAPNVGSGSWGSFQYGPSGAGWTFANGGGISGNGSGFTSGTCNAPLGGQVAFLQNGGIMSQMVPLAAGTYAINFDAAQRALTLGDGGQTFEVLVDGQVVGTVTPASASSYTWYVTNSFTVAGGSHTITFAGLDPQGGDNTAFIDDISMTALTQYIPLATAVSRINLDPSGNLYYLTSDGRLTAYSPQFSALPALANTSFEAPWLGYGSFQYDPSEAGWSFSGDSGIAGNGSGFTYYNLYAPFGSQVAFLQGYSSISQTTFLAGGTYYLSFYDAERNTDNASQTFQVLVDGQVVATVSPLTWWDYGWLQTGRFTVAAGNHTIAFAGLDPQNTDVTALIDNVQIVSVAQATPLATGVSSFSLASDGTLSYLTGDGTLSAYRPQSAAGPALVNPSFETPSVGSGNWGDFQYNVSPSVAGWGFNGQSGVTGNGSGFTDANPNAPDGTQVAFIQGPGIVQQTAYFAGGSYMIGFFAARAGVNPTNQELPVEVLIDPGQADQQVVAEITPPNTSYTWYQTSPFTVPAGNHTIEFAGLDPALMYNSSFIDDVQITSVAQATTVATGVTSNALATGGKILYALAGNTLYQSVGGTSAALDSNVASFFLSPDGATVYYLKNDHTLYQYAGGTPTLVDSGVQSFVQGPGTSSVDVLELDGFLRRYDGSSWTLLGSPQLSIAAPATSTAGTAVTVTVSVKNPNGGIATGYLGTVHFRSSDEQAGLPADYTFTAADVGVHTFTVTFRTAGSQTLVLSDTAQATVMGLASATVSPAAAFFLDITGPSSVTAGSPTPWTVTAYDAYGNVATGYTGTVRFHSTDAQAGLPADYTFAAADQGVHTFSVALGTAGSQSLAITDSAFSSLTSAGAATVSPGAASHFRISVPVESQTGKGFPVTVTALDAYGNVVTGYAGTVQLTSTDPKFASSTYTFNPAGDAGVHVFTVILSTSGPQTITLRDTGNGTVTGSAAVNLTTATSFAVSVPASTTAGAPFSITVTAVTASGTTAKDYRGTVHFTSTDPGAVLPADYTFTPADNGVHTFTGIVFKKAGGQTITAKDTGLSSIARTTSPSNVSPGVAAKFLVSGPATSTAGKLVTITVRAMDAYGNTVTNYAGTVRLASSDPQAVLPVLTYTFTGSGSGHDNGVHTFTGIILKTAGNDTITATDTANASVMGSAAVSVSAAAASKLLVIAPTAVTAGASFSFTVEALDAFGNVATGYVGKVVFKSSDTKAVLPPACTFSAGDQGVHSFIATLDTKGTQALTVTDSGTASITGTDGSIIVN